MHVPAFCGLVSRFESAVEVVIAVIISGSHHMRAGAVSVSPPKHVGGIVDCGVAVAVDFVGMIGCVCCKREKVEPAPAILRSNVVHAVTGMAELGGVDRPRERNAVAPQTWTATRPGVHCRPSAGTFLFFKWGDGEDEGWLRRRRRS
jgi:hypothetical protein